MRNYPKRGDIFWFVLDPTVGSETKKRRPCVILSNDSQNKKGFRVIVAPITSKVKIIYPFEASIILKERECKVMLDQIRALDIQRIAARISTIDSATMLQIEEALKIALALKKYN